MHGIEDMAYVIVLWHVQRPWIKGTNCIATKILRRDSNLITPSNPIRQKLHQMCNTHARHIFSSSKVRLIQHGFVIYIKIVVLHSAFNIKQTQGLIIWIRKVKLTSQLSQVYTRFFFIFFFEFAWGKSGDWMEEKHA